MFTDTHEQNPRFGGHALLHSLQSSDLKNSI